MGGPYQRTAEEAVERPVPILFEIWRYRHLDGIGEELEIEFVDTCNCGAYHIDARPWRKGRLQQCSQCRPTFDGIDGHGE